MAEEVLSTEWVDPATGQKMNTTRLSGTTDSSGNPAGNVVHPDLFAHERNAGTSNQYGVGVGECNITHIAASQADVAVSSGAPALIFGIVMDSGQTGAVTIKDNATTVSAPAIPSGANPSIDMKGAKLNTSLVVTTAVSAACAILWRPQN